MLKIVKYNEDEYVFPSLIVLGCFDGIHIGHTALLKKAKLQAKINGLDMGVMVFTDGKGDRQVYTLDERIALVESMGAKFVLEINFDSEFKKTSAIDFLHNLEEKINVKAYMSGSDFRFGAGAKGKSSTLKKYGEDEENGIWYMSLKDIAFGGEKVSTANIKKYVEEGNISLVTELLGRPYSVKGTVVSGAERGSKILGFPTMNIEYPDKKVEVKTGVYKVACSVDGTYYEGIANYGARPTFGENAPILEVCLNDFSQDMYGKEVEICFLAYLRDIKKYETAEELSAQLNVDMLSVKDPEKYANLSDEERGVLSDILSDEAVEDTAEEVAEETVEVEEENPTETAQVVEEVSEDVATEEICEIDEITEVIEEVASNEEVAEVTEEVCETDEGTTEEAAVTTTETAEVVEEEIEEKEND